MLGDKMNYQIEYMKDVMKLHPQVGQELFRVNSRLFNTIVQGGKQKKQRGKKRKKEN